MVENQKMSLLLSRKCYFLTILTKTRLKGKTLKPTGKGGDSIFWEEIYFWA